MTLRILLAAAVALATWFVPSSEKAGARAASHPAYAARAAAKARKAGKSRTRTRGTRARATKRRATKRRATVRSRSAGTRRATRRSAQRKSQRKSRRTTRRATAKRVTRRSPRLDASPQRSARSKRSTRSKRRARRSKRSTSRTVRKAHVARKTRAARKTRKAGATRKARAARKTVRSARKARRVLAAVHRGPVEPALLLVTAKALEEGRIASDEPWDCVPDQIKAVLGQVAEKWGSVTINSTHRSRRHNRRVGGRPRSFHLKCQAVDFRVDAPTPGMVAWLREHPMVGGYKRYPSGYYHIDVGPRRTW